jgi:hypothetical protein
MRSPTAVRLRIPLAWWIADPETDDVDGNLLVAMDQDGNPL